ncbi:tubulin--tyrosine ligase family protein [Thiotrichales bacterium 19S9-12]|nr:tubulin--tyrosine ligase family protein [Thiotrichales bacterium 19S9-11]MCF6811969.1 tubulin--tyrosine ligase family protein [Thiotrichales bacterium 19S9-12]
MTKSNTKKEKPIIYIDQASRYARNALLDKPFQITDNLHSADLIWVRKNHRQYYELINANQCFNHIPGERALANKGDLAKHLKHYELTTQNTVPSSLKLSEFYQETYRLSDKADLNTFLKKIPSKDHKSNLWIFKPTGQSKGRGIHITWELNRIKQLLSKHNYKQKIYFDKQHAYRYIVQRYIQNPLLLNNKKSEIRIYWLIASLDPLIIYLFNQGTVRLNTKDYILDNFNDPLVHITNIYQQKKHIPEDSAFELKWSFHKFDEYLFKNNLTSQHNFTKNILMPKLKKIILYIMSATKHKLNSNKKSCHFFGLYGADIILDDSLNPWLSEIQEGPGLSWDDPIKELIIPPMLFEALQIVLEIKHKKLTQQGLKNLTTPCQFETVINKSSD